MTAPGRLFQATAFRLALAILGLSALGAGLVLSVIGWEVVSVVDEEMAQTIEAEAQGLADQYEQGGVRKLGQTIQTRARAPGATLYLLTDPQGGTLAGNVERLPAGALDQAGPIDTTYRAPGAERDRRALAQVYLLPGGFRLMVGHDLRDRARIAAVLAKALAISLIFFAMLAALGALFVARRVLGRIDAITTSAHEIMAGDLNRRLPVSGSGDELDRLALGLNDMLARIGELMQGLREVSDNIAHDLRTPLTRLRNHAESALAFGGDAAAYRAALEKTIEESDGLIRIFNALLLIARAEAGGGGESFQVFDVGEAARTVGELYEPIAEEAGVRLTVETEGALTVRGNRELIGQTIANLVDNALKYGAPAGGAAKDAEIAVRVCRAGASVVLSVADRGPGVAAADRSRVLDRFVRLEGSRSRPGSGLGLSLASAVARMHGGSVELDDAMPGLVVRVTLPGAESGPALTVPAATGG